MSRIARDARVVAAACAMLAVPLGGCGQATDTRTTTRVVRGSGPELPTAPTDIRGQPLTGIFLVRPDGSAIHRLSVRGENPAWSPDGRWIAYENDGIWVLDTTRETARRIIDGGAEPAWSPDGARIAFARKGAVYVADTHGGHVTMVARTSCCWLEHPAWSGDGRRLVCNDTDQTGLFALDVRRHRLTRIPGAAGRWAAASSPMRGFVAQSVDGIVAFGPHGGQARLVVPEGHLTNWDHVVDPSWSPRGRTVVFAKGYGGYEIYTRSAEGGPMRRVTRSGASACGSGFCLGYTVDSNPAWSPDGRWIAFDRALGSSLP